MPDDKQTNEIRARIREMIGMDMLIHGGVIEPGASPHNSPDPEWVNRTTGSSEDPTDPESFYVIEPLFIDSQGRLVPRT